MKKILFFLAAATAMLVGCSKSELDVENTPAPVAAENSFIGTFAMNEGTKTTVEPSTSGEQYLVYWEDSDYIMVSCDGSAYYKFTVEELNLNNSQAVFAAAPEVTLPEDFFKQSTYYAYYNCNGTPASYDFTQAGEGSVKHLPMSATAGSQRLLNFKVSVPVMAVKIPTGVSAKGVKVFDGSEAVSTIKSSDKALSAYYIPVPVNSSETKYNISAFTDATCSTEIAESMKMQAGTTMVAGSIYPFTFAPTLEISKAGSYTLKSFPADYRVKILNACNDVSIAYGGSEHPANIYLDAKNNAVTNLTVTAADSHVEIANGNSNTVTSITSKNSLVIKPSYKINTKLTLSAGSAYVEGIEGAANVAQIEIPSEVTAVVNISINTVSEGKDKVLIVNNVSKELVEVIGVKDHEYTLQAGSNDVTEATVVAKIGNTSYSTLEAALTAAKTGETVTLSADAALADQFFISDKDITLDLAGHKVTCAKTVGGGILAVHNGAGLTVNDSVGTGSVKGGSSYAGISVTVKGDNAGQPACLTINGGTIEGYYYGIAGNGSRQNTEITITGGTIKGTATDDSEGIYHPQNGTLIISGGTIEGYSGIYMKSGAVTALTGGTIKGTGAKKAYEYDPNGCSATGDAIIIDNCSYPGGAPSVTISGAALESTNAFQIGAYYGNGKTAISDIYSTDNTLTAANDCVWKETEVAGTYKLAVADPVAKIGDKTYTSLEAAIAAVESDETIQLLGDIAYGEFSTQEALTINNGKDFTLDLAGKTISGTATRNGESKLILVAKGTTLSIKDSDSDGTITYNSTQPDPGWWYGTYTIDNQGTLNLLSGAIVNTTQGGASYAVENHANHISYDVIFNMSGGSLQCDNGDQALRLYANNNTGKSLVNITGGTIVSGGIWANDQTASSTGGCMELNISGTPVIKGNLDIIGSHDHTAITISSGTFTCPKLRLRDSQSYSNTKPYAYISGGTWAITTIDNQNTGAATTNTMSLTGGTYNKDMDGFVAFGYEAVAQGTTPETWAVQKAFVQESDGKYHIYSLAGLKMFRDAANSAAINFGSKTIVIDNTVQTIDLKNEEWVPINSSWNPGFTFDGNGCVIKNLKVDKCENPSSGENPKKYAGLFGSASCSTIQNLTVDGANVKGIGYVAAIAGHGLCAKLVNCTVKNAIITSVVDNNDDGDKAGAICGYLTGQQVAYAKNCYAENCTITAYRDLGGMVGFAQNAEVSNSTIKNVTVVVDNSVDYNGLGSTSTDAHNARLWSGRLDGTTLTGNTEEGTNILKFK